MLRSSVRSLRTPMAAMTGKLLQGKFYVPVPLCGCWRINPPPPSSFLLFFSGVGKIFQCCGSGMFIPDSTFFHPGSELSPSRILIKEFKILTPKKAKKWFLSSKKYDPGCSSRIPDPDADFLPSRIPDPGVKEAPNPGSRIPDPDPQH